MPRNGGIHRGQLLLCAIMSPGRWTAHHPRSAGIPGLSAEPDTTSQSNYEVFRVDLDSLQSFTWGSKIH
jgi:hypothetical protein